MFLKSPITTVFLVIGLLLSILIFYNSYSVNYRIPGNNEGYEPVQPIAYSHRLHAGELGIPCLSCHFGAEKSRNAGIPPANVCMNCHKFVTAPFANVRAEDELAEKEKRKPQRMISPELKKIYASLALNDELLPNSSLKPTPIVWKKVYNVPDFVYFDHRPHVNAGVQCQTCHGAVETMERVRQVGNLSMGWCVNCHRDVNKNGVNNKKVYASTDCTTCHY
jgi:hypothetical protein